MFGARAAEAMKGPTMRPSLAAEAGEPFHGSGSHRRRSHGARRRPTCAMLMWRDAGLVRSTDGLAPLVDQLVGVACRRVAGPLGGTRRSRAAPRRQPRDRRTAHRARRAQARGEPRRPLPRGFPAARRYTLAKTDRRQVRLTGLRPLPDLQTHDHYRHSRSPNRDHAPVPGLRPLVHRRRPPRRAGRLLAGQGLHGDPSVRLRHLGADAAGARPPLQGDRPRQRVLPAVHSRKPADEGERARRGLRAAGRVGDAGRQRGARGAARHPSDLRDDHRHDVREVGAVVARPADPDQPVGERRPLGEGHAAVPAHDRVPLAGRAHRARDGGRGRGRDAARCSPSTRTSPRPSWRCR